MEHLNGCREGTAASYSTSQNQISNGRTALTWVVSENCADSTEVLFFTNDAAPDSLNTQRTDTKRDALWEDLNILFALDNEI